MRRIAWHHCRTALHPSAPKRRRRLRDSTRCQTQLDARRRVFFLMETYAAFGSDIVPSVHLKRQARQRGANHRNTHAPDRPRRHSCSAPHAANAPALQRQAALANRSTRQRQIRRRYRPLSFSAAPNALRRERRVLLPARAGERQQPTARAARPAPSGTVAAQLSKRMCQSGDAGCTTVRS